MFEITQSADIIVDTTLTAFLSADLVTSTGSITPADIMLTTFPVTTSIPSPSLLLVDISIPALSNIVLKGAFNRF